MTNSPLKFNSLNPLFNDGTMRLIKNSRNIQLKTNNKNSSRESTISISTPGIFLKCFWCIMHHIEKSAHDTCCYCILPSSYNKNNEMCLKSVLYNDAKAFLIHILSSHFEEYGKRFKDIEAKNVGKYDVTIINKKLDSVVWLRCPFSDCGIKIKSIRLLLDHMIRRHSETITITFKPTIPQVLKETSCPEDQIINSLKWPIGIKASYVINKDECYQEKSKPKYLQYQYLGLSKRDFTNGLEFSLLKPKIIEDDVLFKY
jgi:hypothetical protein